MDEQKTTDETVSEQTNLNTETESNPQDLETTTNPTPATEQAIDYEKKFGESSKEGIRLYQENQAKDAEIERLRQLTESGASYGDNSDLYPGFEDLDPDAQQNLVNYTNSITRRAKEELYKDPSIAFARQSYNDSKWNTAFEKASTKYPELRDSKEDFKSKYYKADNVPDNIDNILEDLSKVYLFDKSRDIGAREALEQANRIDIERSGGGDKTPPASRTLEDWQKLAASNPAEFAKKSKEYNSDLESGKI